MSSRTLIVNARPSRVLLAPLPRPLPTEQTIRSGEPERLAAQRPRVIFKRYATMCAAAAAQWQRGRDCVRPDVLSN